MPRVILILAIVVMMTVSAISDYSGGPISDREQNILRLALAEQTDIIKLGFSDCNPIKKVIGLDYNQLQNRKPDFSHVMIDLWINETQQQRIPILDSSSKILSSSYYKNGFPIVIFAHGFMENLSSKSVQTMGRSLVQKGGLNVFTMDSSSLIKTDYLRATTYIRFIGEELGKTLMELHKNGVNASSIHLIGHSLGAQIASFAGKAFRDLSGSRVARVTGLDAAGPCFFREDPSLRLTRTDADFVDAIHTTSGVYGLESRIGSADFYPNGGIEQPGCLVPSCSHSRAWDLFAESILRPSAFMAVRCTSWERFQGGLCESDKVRRALMGYGATAEMKGRFYLKTAANMPFGLEENGTFWN